MNGDMMVGIKRERGPEDFRSSNSNGSGPSSADSDPKKMRLEGKPSRVIHVGNIPPDTTDTEIVLLGAPFGRVTNVLVLRSKNQAFLEMTDEGAATNLVQKYSQMQPQIRGRAVYTQFSNHRELKTENASNALLHQGVQQSILAGNGVDVVTDNGGGVNTVLRVIIDNMICPVTLDVLHQIFSRCGKVLKIVTFTKNSTFQALIQFSNDREAQAAKVSLDGQNIYHSCCTLRIDFSKMSSLNVKFNNEKSRDFTNPTLPSGESMDSLNSLNQTNLSGAAGLLGAPFSVGLAGQLNGANGASLAGVSTGLPLLGGFTLPTNNAAGTPVLLVTSLDEHIVTPDHLFTLFGVYGHVLRVKILYSKKDCALVQMADPSQAQNALSHLDKIRVFGKQIHVMPSKYQTVQLPREGQPDAELTKDFTASPRHRFKQSLSKNYQNCHPPTQVLHLSNIPPNATEDNIKEEFTKHGFDVKAFKFFPKDHRMALIQLPSVEDAVDALIKMHDFIVDGNNIRVSFSKSRI